MHVCVIFQSVVEEEEVEEQENDTAQEYRNDGYIELVLKVMARMCDGQNHQLQVGLVRSIGTMAT